MVEDVAGDDVGVSFRERRPQILQPGRPFGATVALESPLPLPDGVLEPLLTAALTLDDDPGRSLADVLGNDAQLREQLGELGVGRGRDRGAAM